MRVIKRNGTSESVQFDQITERITRLCPSSDIDPVEVAQQVCARLHDGITSSELDELSAEMLLLVFPRNTLIMVNLLQELS